MVLGPATCKMCGRTERDNAYFAQCGDYYCWGECWEKHKSECPGHKKD